MSSLIETLNHWGGNFLSFAWPMFWQSSLLIVVLRAFDFFFRRKLRASLRYALWLVVLVKLCMPPTLASPTSPAWWMWRKPSPPVMVTRPMNYTVTYDNTPLPEISQTPLPAFVPPKPAMTPAAWLLVISVSISGALLLWLLVRWWQITRQVRRVATSERLSSLTDEAQTILGMKYQVQARLVANSMSPAVCGLFRPAILIPQSLAENFSDAQLRAVLLHELIHLRRRDVWLNFVQALLQIFYWWHPLLWVANARIRRVREEAVDDAVMLALRDDADAYAPTLLEVAKLALNRPLASLGLVGIMESRHALRQRIERLVDFRPPRRAGLTLVSLLGILAFTAVAVPMGEGPAETNNPALPGVSNNLIRTNSNASPAADFSSNINLAQSPVPMIFKIEHPVHSDELKKLLLDAGVKTPPTVFFYQDNGILLVRGSQDQLALVNRLVLKQNGYSTDEITARDKQFIEQMRFAGSDPQATTNLSIRMSKLEQAGKLLKDALAHDPKNTDARYFLGLVQSDYDRFAESLVQGAKTNQFRSEQQIAESKLTAVRVVQQGKRIYEKVDLDLAERPLNLELAERLFKLASNLDPENADAKHYLGLVQAARQQPKLIYTGAGRQAIEQKLKTIRLDRVAFDAKPLGEVLLSLAEESKTRDPDHQGINFLLNPNVTPKIDPSTGLPIATNAVPAADLRSLPIAISQALTNITLGDALDALVKAAPEPIHYSVVDYAIVFSLGMPAEPLYSRTFKVDKIVFTTAFQKATGLQSTNVLMMVTNFFNTSGVDFTKPGKSIFYNDRLGQLFVRATAQDLDTIEIANQSVIEMLNSDAPQNHAAATNSVERNADPSKLAQDGILLYEMGKLDEAETKFKAVLALDPENAVAKFYLGLAQRQNMESKLKRILITKAEFSQMSLDEVVRQLNEKAKQNDPEKIGVHISTITNYVFKQLADINSVVINLSPGLARMRLVDALDAIVQAANKPIKFSIFENGVVFSAKTPADFAEDAKLLTRSFRSDKTVFTTALQKATGTQSTNAWLMATEFFNSLEVDLTKPGKGIYFNERLGQLDVRATEQDLDTIERAVEMFNSAAPQSHAAATPTFDEKLSASQLVQDGKLLYEMGKLDEAEAKLKAALALDPENATAKYYLRVVRPRTSDLLPTPNTRAQTNLIYTGAGRQVIEMKLDRIRMDAMFDNLPLSEVIQLLSNQVKLRDPDKKGINFMINNNNGAQAASATAWNPVGGGPLGAPRTVDPATGLPPTAAGGGQAMDIRQAVINLNPALTNVRLADVLDAIVQVSDREHPIKYTVEDYAIVFSPKGPDVPQLYSRTFKVDTNTFITGLGSIAAQQKQAGIQTNDVSAMAINVFRYFGVDLTAPGKSIFFNDRRGMLSVRATDQDLDTIERAVQMLNTAPTQVHIKARFVEVEQDDNKALGFNWYLGQFSASNNVAGKGGNSPSNNGPVSAANPLGVFPSNTAASIGGSSNSAPVNDTITGILTDPNFRVVFHALENRPGFQQLAEPEGVTISGRQMQLRETTVMSVITNFTFQETATNSGVVPKTENIELGPVLDATATVLADGYTISLTIKASHTEFLGYHNVTNTTVTHNKAGEKIDLPISLPKIITRQVSTHLNVWDGQTVVLGGLIASSIQTVKDTVPFLGNLPAVGGLFQSERKTEVKQNLMIFVTPTIVDPAGNRVHSDEEMSAKDGVPPQPTQPQPK